MPLSGIDQSTIDDAVRPQDDLYRHFNGGWLKSHRHTRRPAAGGHVHGAARRLGSRRPGNHPGGGRPGRRRHRDRTQDRRTVQQLHGRSRSGGQGLGADPRTAGRGIRHRFSGRTASSSPAGCSGPTFPGSSTSTLHRMRATRTGSCSTPARPAWGCRMSPTIATRSSRRSSRPTASTSAPCSDWPASPTPTRPPPGWSSWRRPWPRTTGTRSRCATRRRPTT